MDPNCDVDQAAVRQSVAKELLKALKKTYGGSVPSLSRIARDLALRSPNLPQVSNETIRKWLIGATLPSAIAILALADWLGSEILTPLKGKNRDDRSRPNKPNDQINHKVVSSIALDAVTLSLCNRCANLNNRASISNLELIELLQTLSRRERELVVVLISALSVKTLSHEWLADKNNASHQTQQK